MTRKPTESNCIQFYRYYWKRFIHFFILFLVILCLTLKIHPAASQTQSFSLLAQSSPALELIHQGRMLYEVGKFNEALPIWQRSLSIYSQQNDPLHQAMTLTYLSLTYQELGEWVEAEQAISDSINLIHTVQEQQQAISREEALSTQLLAQALNARGRLEFSLGKMELALVTWQQATELYQQLGDHEGITGSLINQSQAMEASGHYRLTCNTLLKSLEIQHTCESMTSEMIESILQTFNTQENTQIRILGLRSLGNILRLMGSLAQSQQVLEQDLELVRNSASLFARELLRQESLTLFSLGRTEHASYTRAKDLYERTQLEHDRQQVIEKAQQSLSRYQIASTQSATIPATELIQIQAQVQRLSLLIDFQQWLQSTDPNLEIKTVQSQIQSQVKDLLNQSITNLPSSRNTVYTQLNFAQTLIQLGSSHPIDSDLVQDAFTYAQTALRNAEILGDERARSTALGALGHLYEEFSQVQEQSETWTNAKHYTGLALGLAQSIQAWDIAYQWQWQLGRIAKAQDVEEAIVYYKAAVETLKFVRSNLASIDAEVQFSFRDNVEPVYRQFVELLLLTEKGSEPSQDYLQLAVQEVDALQLSELEDFLNCNLTEAIAINETAIDPSAAVIYPIILETQLAVILRLPQSEQLYLYKTPLPKSEVNQHLISLRQELEKPYLSQKGLSLSQQTYNWLIRSFKPALEASQIKTLVFVLDGSLRNVPMAALHDGQRFLVEEYAVALMPGLQLITPKSLSADRLQVLLFGLSEVQPGFLLHQGFSPLSNVETELISIQSQIPSQSFLNQRFTYSALQELIKSRPFAIVHLATHGQFSSNPKETFILAWDKRVDVNDLSRILQSRAESNLNPIELLVLSACKTANGDSHAALGLAGLAVQSGARSTMASLWSIDDQAASKLMEHFYQELVNTNSPMTRAEALRRAQTTLLQTSGYRAPLYWAPYVLVGSWL